MVKKSMWDKTKKTSTTPQEKTPENTTTKIPEIQAMVWYKKEDYPVLLDLFADRDRLPPTFDAWYKRAEIARKEAEAEGNQVIKIFIDPETFPAWCREKNLTMDAEARSRLAIEVAQSRSFTL